MGAGFFGLLAGGFLGYHLATRDRPEHGFGSGRGWGRCHQQQQQQQQQVPVAMDSNYPSEKTSPSAGPQQNSNNSQDDYALFQQWKQQQQATYGGARSPVQAYTQAPAYNMESMKAAAVDSADKALDALLSQVQVMKEKLAQHKAVVERTVPSTPSSEAGDYKLV